MRMAEGKGKHGNPRHIYLKRRQEELLDVIAKVMGSSRIGIEPARSQLIAKAVENYIEDCRQDPIFRAAIDQAEIRVSSDGTQSQVKSLGPQYAKLN